MTETYTTDRPFDTTRIAYKTTNSSTIARGFVVTFLPNRCVATYAQTYWWQAFMKYAFQMGSGAMICIPNFIQIGSGIQKLIERIYKHTDRKITKYAKNRKKRRRGRRGQKRRIKGEKKNKQSTGIRLQKGEKKRLGYVYKQLKNVYCDMALDKGSKAYDILRLLTTVSHCSLVRSNHCTLDPRMTSLLNTSILSCCVRKLLKMLTGRISLDSKIRALTLS
jgi:hypothetical protein